MSVAEHMGFVGNNYCETSIWATVDKVFSGSFVAS